MNDDPNAPRILNRGEAKVLIPMTLFELREINEGRIPASLMLKLEQGLSLIELQQAREKFKNGKTR